MLEWCERTSRALCGERRPMFVGVRDDGAVRRVYFGADGQPYEGVRKTALTENNEHWLLYNPYGEPGTGYVEWFALERRVAERWIEHTLQAEDYIDVRSTSAREDWPASWRVIVG